MTKKNLSLLVVVLAAVLATAACGSNDHITNPTPTPTPIPTPTGNPDRVSIISASIAGATPDASGVYHLSANGTYTFTATYHIPQVAGRTFTVTTVPTWRNSSIDGPGQENQFGGSVSIGLTWTGATAGNQSITIQIVESGGDLASPYGIEKKIDIVFS